MANLEIDPDFEEYIKSLKEKPLIPEDQEHWDLQLPPRIYVRNYLPTKGRINSISKLEYVQDIKDSLQNTAELDVLMNSQFKKLFEIPARKCLFSGKLVIGMLSRLLWTTNRREMWFVFGGFPIRYSLREFDILIGLNCASVNTRIPKIPHKTEDRYWNVLFGDHIKTITIGRLVEMLREDISGEKKLKIALLIIVKGIICTTKVTLSNSEYVVEMLRDVDAFLKHPWGRESFMMTLDDIGPDRTINSRSGVIQKLKQSTWFLHGFPIGFQLLAFDTIPLIASLIPDSEDEDTFVRQSIYSLSKSKPITEEQILDAEYDPKLVVDSILHTSLPSRSEAYLSWPEEKPCKYVNHIFEYIEGGTQWDMRIWPGGDFSCARTYNLKERLDLKKYASLLKKQGERKVTLNEAVEAIQTGKVLASADMSFEDNSKPVTRKFLKEFVGGAIQKAVGEMRQVFMEYMDGMFQAVDVKQEMVSYQDQSMKVKRGFKRKGIALEDKSVQQEEDPVDSHTVRTKKQRKLTTGKRGGNTKVVGQGNAEQGGPSKKPTKVSAKQRQKTIRQCYSPQHSRYNTRSKDVKLEKSKSKGSVDDESGHSSSEVEEVPKHVPVVSNKEKEKPISGSRSTKTQVSVSRRTEEIVLEPTIQADDSVDASEEVGSQGRTHADGEELKGVDKDGEDMYGVQEVLASVALLSGGEAAPEKDGFQAEKSPEVTHGQSIDDETSKMFEEPGQANQTIANDITSPLPISKDEETTSPKVDNRIVLHVEKVNTSLDNTGEQGIDWDNFKPIHSGKQIIMESSGMGVMQESKVSETPTQDLKGAVVSETPNKTNEEVVTVNSARENIYPALQLQDRRTGNDFDLNEKQVRLGDGSLADYPKTVNNTIPPTHAAFVISDEESMEMGDKVVVVCATDIQPHSTHEKVVSEKEGDAATTTVSLQESGKEEVVAKKETSGLSIVPVKDDKSNRVEDHPLKKFKNADWTRVKHLTDSFAEPSFSLSCGFEVSKPFFQTLAKKNMFITGQHMEVLTQLIWDKRAEYYVQKRISIVDHLFGALLSAEYPKFKASFGKPAFKWHHKLIKYVQGRLPVRDVELVWMKDVDKVYFPMKWDGEHWVGLVIDLAQQYLWVLDGCESRTSHADMYLKVGPVVEMLPFLLNNVGGYGSKPFPTYPLVWARIPSLYQDQHGGDCGPLSIKFIEMHSLGFVGEELRAITDKDVENFRKQYAVDVHTDYVE